METTKKIREDMNRRIRTKENRDFLEIIIKNHILELQNIELEINLQIQEKMIANLASISAQQKTLIDSNNLSLTIDDHPLLDIEDNIELEIDEEDEVEEDGEEELDLPEEDSKHKRKASQKAILKNISEEEEKPNKKNKELKIPPIKGVESRPN